MIGIELQFIHIYIYKNFASVAAVFREPSELLRFLTGGQFLSVAVIIEHISSVKNTKIKRSPRPGLRNNVRIYEVRRQLTIRPGPIDTQFFTTLRLLCKSQNLSLNTHTHTSIEHIHTHRSSHAHI